MNTFRRHKPAPALTLPRSPAQRLKAVLITVGGLFFLLTTCCSKKNESAVLRKPPVTETASAPTPPPVPVQNSAQPLVRVAIVKNSPSLRIGSGGPARVLDRSGRDLRSVASDTVLNVTPANDGLNIDGTLVADGYIRIQAQGSPLLKVNDQEVAHSLIVYTQNRTLTAVAQLEMEEYTAGVLAGEVPYERWHPEALQAQAIVSRSFAYYQVQRSAGQPYDVESTVMSQVFKPGFRSQPLILAALNSTRGRILTNDGQPFSAYFHSTCGHHTEPGYLVFPEQSPIKALSGTGCNYCSQSPAYRWQASFTKSDLEQKLRASGGSAAAIHKIQSLEFLNAANVPLRAWDRVATVRIRHSGGETVLKGNAFRLAVGPRELKSLLFEKVVDHGATLQILGGGYGHGVGLCQWGSQGLAQAGYSHEQILGKYYPGAELTRLY